jgi:hypothetical protein
LAQSKTEEGSVIRLRVFKARPEELYSWRVLYSAGNGKLIPLFYCDVKTFDDARSIVRNAYERGFFLGYPV